MYSQAAKSSRRFIATELKLPSSLPDELSISLSVEVLSKSEDVVIEDFGGRTARRGHSMTDSVGEARES